jgi:hypothetical protein
VRMHSHQAAWVQGAVLIAAGAAIAAAIFLRLQRPFDRETLALQVSQLQSHAAEADALAAHVRADHLAPGFVRQHAQQLAGKVGSVDHKLHSKPSQANLEASRLRAQQLGAALQEALDALSRNGRQPRRQDLGFAALAQRLDTLHQTLKPGD